MKKRFISVFLVLAVASIMIVTGCSTMRYETFDSGLEKDAEPYSEEEQALRDQLWDDAIAIEDFEDAELEPEFQYLADLDTVEIKKGFWWQPAANTTKCLMSTCRIGPIRA